MLTRQDRDDIKAIVMGFATRISELPEIETLRDGDYITVVQREYDRTYSKKATIESLLGLVKEIYPDQNGAKYQGIAHPNDTVIPPVGTDGFWIAIERGTYTHFNNIAVTDIPKIIYYKVATGEWSEDSLWGDVNCTAKITVHSNEGSDNVSSYRFGLVENKQYYIEAACVPVNTLGTLILNEYDRNGSLVASTRDVNRTTVTVSSGVFCGEFVIEPRPGVTVDTNNTEISISAALSTLVEGLYRYFVGYDALAKAIEAAVGGVTTYVRSAAYFDAYILPGINEAANSVVRYVDSAAYLNEYILPMIQDGTRGLAVDADYEYLKTALQNKTSILGGLMLTSLIQLGATQSGGSWTVRSGINGALNTTLQDVGKSIAVWFGGEMLEKDVWEGESSAYQAAHTYAKGLFRMDGSGYLANKNIYWDESGNLTINGYVLTSEIQLRDSNNNVKAGLSGNYDASAYGQGIAAWYGGPKTDRYAATPQPSTYAKTLFRMDGSGYLAGGALRWGAGGELIIQGTGSDIEFTDGNTIVTIENLISLLEMRSWFRTVTDGNVTYLELITSSTGINGFVTGGFIQSGGYQSGGGGNTGTTIQAVWQSLTNSGSPVTPTTTTKIAPEHIPIASTNALGGVKVDGSTITIDANGVISSGGSGSCLPLTAGPGSPLTGALYVSPSNDAGVLYMCNIGNGTYNKGAVELSSSQLVVEAPRTTDNAAGTKVPLKFGWRGGTYPLIIDADGNVNVTSLSTLILSKTTDASGIANNGPALIVGGTAATAHLEMDSNELMAKANGTTATTLYLNAEGGDVVLCETSGYVGIGVTNPTSPLHIISSNGDTIELGTNSTGPDNTRVGIGYKSYSATYRWFAGSNDNNIFYFWNSYRQDVAAFIDINANFVCYGQVQSGTASSIELKDDIVNLSAEKARSIVMAARPVEFRWNDLAHSLCNTLEGDDIGLIAQEAGKLIPSAVSPIWDKYKKLDYTKFIAPMLKVEQNHEQKIKELERRISELETENKKLRCLVN